jgi:mannitol/fructose-specific phosphotransferase system IIA component
VSETDESARYLPRIREELDKLPLTTEQKAAVTPTLLEAARFIDTEAGRVNGGKLREDSGFFDFDSKIRAVAERFKAEGLTREDYLQAAVKQPQLFYQAPDTIEKNIKPVVERFAAEGLTTKDYLAAAVKQPSLFAMSPETVEEKHIRPVVERFADHGLTAKKYIHAAVKSPSLFAMSPEKVAANITGVVERFAADGLTVEDYLQAAVRQSQLFVMSPDTVEGNIRGVVERFSDEGLTTKDYLQAAVKQPSLFTQSPETIENRNIRPVVKRFSAEGLTTEAYLQAAVKQPPLFYQSPETIGRHIDLVFDLYDKGVLTLSTPRRQNGRQNGHPHAPVLDFLIASPHLLTLEDNNYVLRELHQRMTGADPSPENLRRTRRQTEHELMRHLGHGDQSQPVPDGFIAGQEPPTEQQARNFVLRALAREGYLKSAEFDR